MLSIAESFITFLGITLTVVAVITYQVLHYEKIRDHFFNIIAIVLKEMILRSPGFLDNIFELVAKINRFIPGSPLTRQATVENGIINISFFDKHKHYILKVKYDVAEYRLNRKYFEIIDTPDGETAIDMKHHPGLPLLVTANDLYVKRIEKH